MKHVAVIDYANDHVVYKIETTEEVLSYVKLALDRNMASFKIYFSDGSSYEVYGKDYLDEA